MHRRTAFYLSSAVVLACPFAGWAATPVGTVPHPLVSLAELSSMHFGVNVEATEPINGFTPQMVVGYTNEENHSDSVEGFGTKSGAPGGSPLPAAGMKYVIATLDSGSQGHIISYDDYTALDFPGSNRDGTKSATVEGASGTEDLSITDAIGVYATDFSNASVSGGGVLSTTAGSMRGQWNVPVLAGNQDDGLPNIVGSPMLAQYRATILNSQPRHLTVNGTTFKTPTVSISDFSTTLPAGYSKLTLKTSDSGAPDAPFYINYDFTGPNNPDTPGGWESFLTNAGVSLSRNGTAATGQTFMLDTGAQVSVISNDTAASVGIFNVSPETADFTVDVLGVGGITHVPGYYLSTMSITTQGGILNWNRVPVLVLDLPDPRDPTSVLPGILGTNLFSDRDLILNTNVDTTGQVYLGIGPQMMWNFNGSGTWSTTGKWNVVLPDGIDTQANFYGAITAPATVTVDSPRTVGSIAFDNANRYTVSGSAITLSVSADQAQINVRTGSHTIAAPIALASDTIVTVVPLASTLTLSGVISAAGTQSFTKTGAGTTLLSNTNTFTGDTDVLAGTLTITGSIASTNVSTETAGTLNANGATNAGLSTTANLVTDGITNVGANSGAGIRTVKLASVLVEATGVMTLNASALHGNRTVLVTGSLSTTDSGKLDLKDNDLVIHGGSLAAVQSQLASGLNLAGGVGGYWNGNGIVSSAAAGDSTLRTTLAVILNNNGSGSPIYSTVAGNPFGAFDSQNTAATDVLVKFTWYGDADLNGKVNGTDYSQIDNGFNTHLHGWINGDFNYDGVVDGTDYSLIDNVYNTQGAPLSAGSSTLIATATTEVAGSTSAVPEPNCLALLGVAALSLARKRHRHR